MKKIYILFLFNSLLHAQIGVGTVTPKATLEVVSLSNNNTTTPEGILIPRISRLKAMNMIDVQISTLVYIDNINDGSATGKAINITTPGYYYYNDNIWNKLLTKNDNIYTTDGAITENRLFNLNANSIAFSGTGPNGIIQERRSTANSSPSYIALRKNNINQAIGNGSVTANQYLGVITFGGNTGNGYEGDALSSKSSISAISAENYSTDKQGSHLIFNTVPIGSATSSIRMKISSEGNIGINTSDPSQKLDVNGKVKIRDTELLSSTSVKPLFIDTNGLVGTSNVEITTPKTYFAANKTSSDIMTQFNSGNIFIIPLPTNSEIINTLNINSSDNTLTINQDGIYQISGSINLFMSTGNENDKIYIAINIQKQAIGSSNWTSIAGSRPIFITAGEGGFNYNTILPVAMEPLSNGDKIRFVLYRTVASNNSLQGSSLTTGQISNSVNHGTKGSTLFISKM